MRSLFLEWLARGSAAAPRRVQQQPPRAGRSAGRRPDLGEEARSAWARRSRSCCRCAASRANEEAITHSTR